MTADELDRRAFLRRAGIAGGAALGASLGGGMVLGGCGLSSPGRPAPSDRPTTTARTAPTALLDLPAKSSPISHVVVLMLENRSFDHWLGWLADDHAYLESGRRRYGATFSVTGNQNQRFAGPNGEVATAHLVGKPGLANPFRGCGHPDPGHSWGDGRAERDQGFLAPQSGNDPFALGYYEGADLPFTARLASRFSVCDHSFASLLASTFPNRMYLHSAQSGGHKDNTLPTGNGFEWDTIWDRLLAAQVPCAYYKSDLPVTFLWGSRLQKITHGIDDYFTACKAGKLPAVTFIDPAFIGPNRTDNHPFGDINAGERFARDAFAAFARSPHWEHGAFILTYDEWGGFFEHVAPPTLPDDRASTDDDNDFSQAGFRVPTIVASPFARAGFVDHAVYDHTSILRFLEWRFLGAPATGAGGDPGWSLTKRDRHANNIASSLVTEANRGIGFDLDMKIAAPTPACAGDTGGGLGVSLDTSHGYAYDEEPGLRGKGWVEQVRDTGWFDDHGVDVSQSSMVPHWAFG